MAITKIIKTGNSADSAWMNSEAFINKTFQFRVIDNSDVEGDKRVVIWISETENSNSDWKIWQDLTVRSNRLCGFNFTGTDNIVATVNGVNLYGIDAIKGKKYTNSGNFLVESGDASSGAIFQVANSDSSHSMVISVKRNGNTTETVIAAASGTRDFGFRPTFWIGVVDFGEVPHLEDINTEISTFGVSTADIVISNGGGPPYSFSLNNVTYA